MSAEKTLDAGELLRLVEAGDIHGALLLVGGEWLRRYYPASRFATIGAELGVGVPMARHVILGGDAASSSGPPRPA